MSGDKKKERVINILYIPGGAMLGIVPAVVLARLEELTETPTAGLFQVMDGVSTGSILVGGLNVKDKIDPAVPKMTANEGVEMFCDFGPQFFPDIPNRYYKMMTANIISMMQDSLDPERSDALVIREISKICKEAMDRPPGTHKNVIEDIEKAAVSKWLTRSAKNEILKSCEKLGTERPDLKDLTQRLSELVFVRTSNGHLSRIFKKAAISTLGTVKKYWAKEFLFDPKNPERVYKRLFGTARMSDCVKSTYISAYDLDSNKVKTFFNRKLDFFSTDPNAPSVTSKENAMIWDAVMASTANPFAFPPHVTEDKTLCADKAPVHTPLPCVLDVLKHKPRDAKVKLVVLGTGRYLTSEHDQATLGNEYARYGVLGNILRGRELSELEGYTMSAARRSIRQALGNENIIEISPRMSPHTYGELRDFPNRDVLDASKDNLQKILRRAQRLLVEEDKQIRSLAQMLAENLHNLGQMDDEKFKRVSRRIGIQTESKPLESGIGQEIQGLIKRTFGRITLKDNFNRFLGTNNSADYEPPQLPPPEPPPPPVPKP